MDSLSSLDDIHEIGEIISICCRVKAEVVSKDEKEGGLRRILNFGHTLGHALEAATEYGFFKHGEAVVHGMRWACWVSNHEGYLSDELFTRVDTLLKKFDIPNIPETITSELLLEKSKLDKKQTESGLNIVLIDELGSALIQNTQSMKSYIQGWFKYEC